jgi:hypothetical protein
MSSKLHYIYTLLLILLLYNLLFAAAGKITGKITDAETGEPLIGVNVLITHTIIANDDEVPVDNIWGASTDVNGYYVILNITPGVYVIKASLVGYQTVIQKYVKVEFDRTTFLDFQLSETIIEVGEVTVIAKQELVKQDVSGTREIITTTRLQQMPVLRVDEFMGSLKGVEVVSGTQGHGLSIRGGAIRETDIRLDGISLQDPRTENSYLALNTTSIQEIQVLTSGFQAKYGGIRSGLLNVVTKDGSRDRYSVSIRTDFAPADQKRFFGTNPWSNESWVYRVYAGEYAFSGISTAEDSMIVPSEFHSFRGWSRTTTPPLNALDSLQRLELWKLQHPQYSFMDKPDYFIEGSISGPIPGSSIPFFGEFASRTTFLLGFKYENSRLSFPIGPRNNYLDWNTQLKLTSGITDHMRLSANGLFAKVETVSGGGAANYGGALVDQASSFSFLNSTESSVRRQANLIGGFNHNQMFNKSRLQFYDGRIFIGGLKLTHTLSGNAFYAVEFQMGYTDQDLKPFSFDASDTTKKVHFFSERANRWYSFNVPDYGSPDASTNYGTDILNTYNLYGGPQRVDSSYSYVYQFKGDLTAQLGKHHQVDIGISARLQDLFIYTGTWFQAQLSYTPDTWQYYSATPLEAGLYIQDKLEFEGMILNAGLRFDYLNPMKKSFRVGFPLSEEFTKLLNETYHNLPGESGSYEKWVFFREFLESPPGWPTEDTKVQFYLSPRMGVSFPITEASKLYFNYGHFYQRPPASFMYNLNVVLGGVQVPTPNLDMAKTVSYEFGYEQLILDQFIINATAYYKDVRNEPLGRTYINYYEDNIVTEYVPDAYRDIRGVELRLERPVGDYVTFSAMYDYMLQSWGQTGLGQVYENRLKARDRELRSPNISTSEPMPRANINLNLRTPREFGPEFLGIYLLEEIYANFFFEWRDGGRILLNPEEPDVKLRNYVDAVDYWNVDFRGSKAFVTNFGSIEFVITIKNLTNNKWLIPGNMLQTQYDEYIKSLQTPDKGGDDKWGQWKSDDGHINTGWWEAPIFLNPRRIILGLRLNF